MLSPIRAPIIAELAWSDHATAFGIVAQATSPVLMLCQRLIAAGYDPATPLEAWRGSTLCLRVGSIGEAAELEINSKGSGFIKRAVPVRAASPVRLPDETEAAPLLVEAAE